MCLCSWASDQQLSVTMCVFSTKHVPLAEAPPGRPQHKVKEPHKAMSSKEVIRAATRESKSRLCFLVKCFKDVQLLEFEKGIASWYHLRYCTRGHVKAHRSEGSLGELHTHTHTHKSPKRAPFSRRRLRLRVRQSYPSCSRHGTKPHRSWAYPTQKGTS